MSAVPSKKNAWYEIPDGCETLRHLPTVAALADLGEARLAINSLAAKGVEDIEGALASDPIEAARVLDLVRVVWINDEGRRIFGPDSLPVGGVVLRERAGAEGIVAFRRILVGLDSGDDWVDSDASLLAASGRRLSFRVRAAWLAGHKGDWSAVALFIDGVQDERGKAVGRFEQWTHGKKLFRNMTVGFALHEMIFDTEGRPEDYRFLMVNHAFENMTGLKRTEIIGRRATEVVPGLERSWIEAYGEVTRTGKPAWFQSYSVPLDRYYEVRAYRPDPGIFAVMVQDISERLKDEEALANRERLFRAVLETAGEGFFMADAEGRLVEVNGAYSAMQGYSRRELLTMSIFDQGAGYTRDRVSKRLEAIRRDGHNTFEAIHLRKDGRLVDVEISATWIKEWGGRFIAFVRDITERKRAERLIREQGERLALALNGTAAGIWDWDIATGDLILDDSFGRVIGYPPEELVGQKKDRWKEICHPEDLARSAACLEAHLSGKAPRYECEVRLRHRDGKWIWVLNQGELVERDGEGRPARMIGIMFDIGRQKDTEETLRKALADKDSLLRELHHRTKNSMQLINAMLELKKRELPAGEVTAAFDNIQNKVLAMALVQEKLYEADTLSRIDLGSYVRDLVGLLESEMPLASVNIAFEAEAEEIEVTADIAVPCGIIVSELVGNSISHAFPRRERGRISVSVRRSPAGEISIEERDDGVGLPEGYDPRKEGRVGLRTVIGIGEEQLHGKVVFDGKPGGFACRLDFKNLYYPKRV